jgi:hypothetical protein
MLVLGDACYQFQNFAACLLLNNLKTYNYACSALRYHSKIISHAAVFSHAMSISMYPLCYKIDKCICATEIRHAVFRMTN